jgi:hypothetical protein
MRRILHRIRLTEPKIAHRLELVESLVYRRSQLLPDYDLAVGTCAQRSINLLAESEAEDVLSFRRKLQYRLK